MLPDFERTVSKRAMTARSKMVIAAGLLGALSTLYATTRTNSVGYLFESGYWDIPLVGGALAGAFVGNAVWVLMNASQQLSRAAVVAVLVNLGAWSFFLTTPTVTETEWAKTQGEGLALMTGEPIMLAGRWTGTHGPVNTADRLLMFTADPANHFGQMVVVLSRPGDPMRSDSWIVAAIGFVVSMAFWIAAGNSLATWRKKRRIGKPQP
jgi:hypothetical protein